MALSKTLRLFTDTGLTVYAVILRDVDGYYLNDADGSFAAAPSDRYLSLTEDATVKGLYTVSESRTAWDDGEYSVLGYEQSGGSPATASDFPLGSSTFALKDDAEVDLSDITLNTQGLMVLLSRLNTSLSQTSKDLLGAFEMGLGKIRPAILDLQQSLLRGRK